MTEYEAQELEDEASLLRLRVASMAEVIQAYRRDDPKRLREVELEEIIRLLRSQHDDKDKIISKLEKMVAILNHATSINFKENAQ